jgi:hypothetical protein
MNFRVSEMTMKNEFDKNRGFEGFGLWAALVGVLMTSSTAHAYAVKCKMHLGSGCGGPVVYEIQLCSKASVNGPKCQRLCEGLKPVCGVTQFDPWVAAYNSGGFASAHLGKNGFKGDLAQPANTDTYDNSGQLTYTSGNAYTVCISTAPLFFSFSSEHPVSATAPSCPVVVAASESNCSAGTRFDPVTQKCATMNSYCAGDGAGGNYASTVNAGLTMIAVQNQHFVVAPTEDNGLQNHAATAGSVLPGLIAPIKAAQNGDLHAQNFQSSNSGVQGTSAMTGGLGGGSAGMGTTGSTTDSAANAAKKGNDSDFASKDFAMEGSGYGKGGGGGNGGAGGSGGAGGPSWFGGGAGAAVTAGESSGDLGFEKGGSRGLASDGRLNIEDPENYFLMSDVGTSLFKRVTAQCRKKERSLVLAK